MLLKRGADPYIEDCSGRLPLYYATKEGFQDVADQLGRFCTNRIEELTVDIRKGIFDLKHLFLGDLCNVNSDGQTLLMVAVKGNRKELVSKILHYGKERKRDSFKDAQDTKVSLCALVQASSVYVVFDTTL